jgi:hypothetical protein
MTPRFSIYIVNALASSSNTMRRGNRRRMFCSEAIDKRTRPNENGVTLKAPIATAFCLWAPLACPALASDDCKAQNVDIQQVGREVADYLASKGETLPEFADRVGSSSKSVIAFVSATEKCGGAAVDALQSMERSAEAVTEPTKRRILQCFGVRLPDDANEVKLTPEECDLALEKLGFTQGLSRR